MWQRHSEFDMLKLPMTRSFPGLEAELEELTSALATEKALRQDVEAGALR